VSARALYRGRDLLDAVLRGESTVVPAVAFWRHHPVADQDATALAEATLAFHRRVECDFVKITPASSFQLIEYGLQDQWVPDGIGHRSITHRPIVCPEDWLRLPSIRPGQGFSAQILLCSRLVRRAVDKEIPVIQTIFNPVFQAIALAGIERFLEHLESAPEELAQGLRTITHNTTVLINRFRDDGVDGFFLASQHARASALPWPVYQRWASPGDQACIAAMKECMRIMHLHGESVYLDACPSGTDVLHYDCTLPNPTVNETLLKFPGTVSSVAAADELPQRRYIISGGCAVPLGVSDASLATLVRKFREC
jgi:uroporphyrinogen decarboxylase